MRTFTRTSERHHGQPANTYRLVCGACGATEALHGQDFGQNVAKDIVPKKFKTKGWEVGKREADDRCPACVNREQLRSRALAKLRVVQEEPMADPVKLKADAPREMSRDERRLIFGKLNEVYLDEKRGYDDGWTDKRVADDLGIPRAWVSKVRDENFGPDNANPEARALVAEAKTILDEVRRQVEKAESLTKRMVAIERLF